MLSSTTQCNVDSEELFTLLRYYKREQTLAITFLENNNQQDCQLLPYIKILGTFKSTKQ